MPDGNYVIQILLNAKDQSVKAVLQDTGGEVKKFASDTEDMANRVKSAFTGAAIAMTFGRAIPIMRESIDAYVKAQNALNGVKAAADATGTSFDQALTFLKAYTKDGLVPMEDASTSLRNLLQSGYGLPQAIDILNRFKDSAAYGRKEQILMGDAVRFATEALKVGNQRGLDAISITGDMSVAQKQYADGVGTTTAKLTDAEKRQANYDSIMSQTNRTIGNAVKLHGEVAGKMAEEEKAANDLKEAIGGALAPAYSELLKAETSALDGTKGFVEQYPKITATLLGGSGLIKQLAVAAVAFRLMGTAGVAALGITSGLIGYAAAVVGVAEATGKFHDELSGLNDERTLEEYIGDVPEASGWWSFFFMLGQQLGIVQDQATEAKKRLDEIVLAGGGGGGGGGGAGGGKEPPAVVEPTDAQQAEMDAEIGRALMLGEAWTGTSEALMAARAALVDLAQALQDVDKAPLIGPTKAAEAAKALDAAIQKLYKDYVDGQKKAKAAGALDDLMADWADAGPELLNIMGATSDVIADSLSGIITGEKAAWESFFKWVWQELARIAVRAAIVHFILIPLGLSEGGEIKRAQGGMVVGGTPGRDSVPILAQQGELIASTHLTAKLDRMATGWESIMATAVRGPEPALAFAGSSGRGDHFHFHTMDYPSYRRAIRNGELGREVRTAIKYGRFHP